MARYQTFAKGVNFMGQLGLETNTFQNSLQFEPLPSLQDFPVKQLEAHLTQSYALLNDNQIVHWGWILDSLTSIRTLNYYKSNPQFWRLWQKYSFVGNTVGMRNGSEYPILLNRNIIDNPIKKIAVGGCFIHSLTEGGQVYAMGENYKGQLGLGEVSYKQQFTKIPIDECAVDIANGFQHSLILTKSGRVFASGRANLFQFSPNDRDGKIVDHYINLKLMAIPSSPIIKIAAGYHHSLVLTKENKVYAVGQNNYGQCGSVNYDQDDKLIKDLQEVYLDLNEKEIITQLACGKSHSLVLTNSGRIILFGATNYNQLGQNQKFKFDQTGPVEVKLPLKTDEKVIRIKAGFNQSCAFTNQGDCIIWGGEQLDKQEIPSYLKFTRLRELLGREISDVGLGYTHTLVHTNYS